MTTTRWSQNARGQTVLEYVAVALAIIGVIVALNGGTILSPGGPIFSTATGLMNNVRHQLQSASGTADFLF